MFHFIFVPLTLGLTWILVAMEATYLKTGKPVYKDMTRFWGKLLAINFAIGVITGLTMEFEFGLNWAYFSRMIGGSFGPVLAIEGITAFMLEATMFGLFFFSWDKLSRRAHFIVTFFMAFGASLSIVNILAANSWMQHPIASTFDYQNMTMQLSSISALYLHYLAQIRIGHVAFAGFMVSSIFVMGISAYYLLRNQDVEFAKRSFAIGVGFAFICSIMVVFFGDQNGIEVAKDEPEKMAAIEAQWQTQKAPQ
ncbi:MAG: cytochrome ubiquinol oxidase subunit I, partial [Gammaproteobacteria bacterium]|nr:cytochrome ubiquinol oxidase subunit I [Gammaproteobacteria bacterium]